MPRWQQLVIGSGAALLAIASGINSQANRWRVTEPERALEWRSGDAVALTMNADIRNARKELSAADGPAMADVARSALRDEPLTPAAMRQLAVADGLIRGGAATPALLTLSHRMSRRDFGTSWLLIEQALSNGDLSLMVRSFDEALLTNTVAPDLIHPALSASLFDPSLRSALRPYLRNDAAWMPAFLRYAVDSDSSETALFVLEAGELPKTASYMGLSEQLLSKLAAKADYGVARRFLRGMADPDYKAEAIFGIEAATLNPVLGPFGWRLFAQPEMGVEYDGKSGLNLHLDPERRGVFASRIFLLNPGAYRVSRKLTQVGSPSVRLDWSFECLSAGQRGSQTPVITKSPVGDDQGSEDIIIPAGCPAQRIGLSIENLAMSDEVNLTVESISLKSIR